jgi:predicted nucleotidyltransferase
MSAAEALDLARRVEQACSHVLGDVLAAVILHGSLVLGDFVPGRSDVDLLVVAEESLTDDQRAALVAAMPDSAARVDLRVVTRTVASSPTPVPPLDTYVTLKAGRAPLLEAQNPGERDLVVEFATCREHGRSLRGAEPSAVLGAVPDDWVLDVGEAQLADWQLQFSAPHAELMVLTACRVWRFAEERRHCSKKAAAEWALAQDPSLDVVRAALRRRYEDPSFPIEEPWVRELLARVRRPSA